MASCVICSLLQGVKKRMTEVLLAAGQPDLRLSIELLLTIEPGVVIVGEASEADGLRALIRSTSPDVVILDWELPGHDVETIIADTQNERRQPHFVVLSNRFRAKQHVLAAGAEAFVVKGDPPDQLMSIIRSF